MKLELKQEFEKAVADHLNQLSRLMETELKAVISKEFPSTVKFFLFEYDSPHFSDDFPLAMYPMGIRGELVDDASWFLKGKAVVIPAEIYENMKYEELEPWESTSKLFENWLRERWLVIRKDYATPAAFIGHHDSFFKSDMDTGKQLNWEEITKKFND